MLSSVYQQYPFHRGTLATLLKNHIRAHLSFPFFLGSKPVIHRSPDLTFDNQKTCPCHFSRGLIYAGYCCAC
ncbi:hypothetical protein ECDEC5E_0458 [Escherichia coli DEC5E]|nr:hypothetical protein ECDEC5E_0458 [Escherichia coli DEC5E]